MSEYKVKFEVFEGPLDLLLYLIKKEEVDIYEVNLTKLATQFIEHIETMRMLDLDVAGEFLVMAATLMYIKSRELLPVDKQVQPEGEDDGDDPRWELIRQLVAYKKFKDAAARLAEMEARQENIYPRISGTIEFEQEPFSGSQATIFDLVNAVSAVLKRYAKKDNPSDIFEEKWTVSEKIDLLMRSIEQSPDMKFSELFAGAVSRSEIIVTFMAVLELIRLKQIVAVQPGPFAEIEIHRAPPPPPEPKQDELALTGPESQAASQPADPDVQTATE